MKKNVISILLSLCIPLLATGCANEASVPTTNSTIPVTTGSLPTETTMQTEPVEIPDLPLLAFSAPVQTQNHYAEDGTLLFTYAYQDISLILEDPQIADDIAIDLLNYVDYENSSAKRILSDAQSAYDGQEDWISFAYSTFFSPARFDQGVLSLYGTHSTYSGSPRSVTTGTSISYDLLSGRQLSLTDILVKDYSADTLSQLITNALTPLSEQGLLFSDYAYVVSELFTTNRPVDSWYFSESSLCFYFAPYEIAPFSSGTITAEIPYSALIGLLKEEYFPAEISEFSGSHYVLSFQDAKLEQFDQFAELVLEENGKQYLLYTDGCLQNLRIELGSRLDDGSFHPEAAVFSAPTLCAGNGIVIHASEETIHSLQITYKDGNSTVTVDISSEVPNS